MRIIFEHSEKYRAQLLEKVGFLLCTPCCSLILLIILQEIEFGTNISISLVCAALLFIIGTKCIDRAYDTIYELDIKIRRTSYGNDHK